MPGRSYSGPLPPPTPEERQSAARLRSVVDHLAAEIGGRSVLDNHAGLRRAADYLNGILTGFGLSVTSQPFRVAGKQVENIIAEIPGVSVRDEVVVIGAHYDTAGDLPGANDNGSGVAATLLLAELACRTQFRRTLRFALFANEEPPHFMTEEMGSLVYALSCRERREDIVAMLALETIGYYSDAPHSQRYPFGEIGGFPTTADFIGFVGDLGSAKLVQRAIGIFREHTAFPSEGIAAPSLIPGVGWSDHWSFWQAGYRALMVTDTALYRYDHYHTAQDTPDKLDYSRMARVVSGIKSIVWELAGALC
jgi:Zn-dependent M28 family amino/carboxypeptidase